MAEADPIVSVLVPAYDAADTLAACLRSVARQTERRLECVVVDDGSRDETADVARAAAEGDRRFRLIRIPHAGIVAALNEGLGSCRGRYVARMDADDWMHRDRLRLQLVRLEAQPELAGVGCHVRLFPRAGLQDGRRAYECWLNAIEDPRDVRCEAFVECPIAHPTLVLRRRVLDGLGYRDRGWPEDYDLVLRLLERGDDLAVVPRRLVGWRDGPGRLSRTGDAYARERFVACKAEFLARGFLRDSREYVLWGYGATGRALRRALAEHGRHPSHIVELHPGRLQQRIHGARVVPPSEIPALPRHPLLVSVAGTAARTEIRKALHQMNRTELQDYLCTA